MKVWVLLFVAAVCVQMPSEGSAKHLGPNQRALGPANLSEVKRHAAAFKKRSDSSEEADKMIREFLESAEVEEFLRLSGISMKMINDLVDNDDEIEPEDRDLFKAILILSLAGIDVTGPEFWTDIEKRSVFKK